MSELYYKAGNKDLWLKYAEKFAGYTDEKFDAYCVIGENFKNSGDLNNAVFYYEKALAVYNSDPNSTTSPENFLTYNRN